MTHDPRESRWEKILHLPALAGNCASFGLAEYRRPTQKLLAFVLGSRVDFR